FEGSIMGNGGQEFGLALYEKAGAIERIATYVDAGRMDMARREDCIAVTLDAKPRFAVDALKDAFGLPRVPYPMRLKRGRHAQGDGAGRGHVRRRRRRRRCDGADPRARSECADRGRDGPREGPTAGGVVVAKPSVQNAWAAEIVRRVEELRNGAVEPI